MILYRAVVEDNKDPEKIGRVKVRIHGVHTSENGNGGEAFAAIKTEDLPWAEVMGSTAFGLVGGVGVSSVLRQGTWVWVMLEMGDQNKPVIVGTISGINSEDSKGKASGGEGFYDPDEVYPYVKRSAESDINRLARNEKLSEAYYDEPTEVIKSVDGTDTPVSVDTTAHDKINQTLNEVTETDGVSGTDPTFKEPASLSDAAVYPDTSVIETQSGHVVEIDDTSGNERIRVYHRTGSYVEIRPDGSFVQKSVGTEANYYMHAADVNELITASVNRYVSENIDEIIKGYVHRFIEGEVKEHVGGNINYDSDGNVVWNVGGNFTLNVSGKIDIDAGPEIDMDAGIINLN